MKRCIREIANSLKRETAAMTGAQKKGVMESFTYQGGKLYNTARTKADAHDNSCTGLPASMRIPEKKAAARKYPYRTVGNPHGLFDWLGECVKF